MARVLRFRSEWLISPLRAATRTIVTFFGSGVSAQRHYGVPVGSCCAPRPYDSSQPCNSYALLFCCCHAPDHTAVAVAVIRHTFFLSLMLSSGVPERVSLYSTHAITQRVDLISTRTIDKSGRGFSSEPMLAVGFFAQAVALALGAASLRRALQGTKKMNRKIETFSETRIESACESFGSFFFFRVCVCFFLLSRGSWSSLDK